MLKGTLCPHADCRYWRGAGLRRGRCPPCGRLRAGGFSIEDAITLEQAAALAESGRLEEAALCADVLFTELPALRLTAQGERAVKNGAPQRTRTKGRPLPPLRSGRDVFGVGNGGRRAGANQEIILLKQVVGNMRKPCAAALGFFDGVHAAHMRVLRAAVSYAAAHGMEPVAVTFDRSPKAFVTAWIRR